MLSYFLGTPRDEQEATVANCLIGPVSRTWDTVMAQANMFKDQIWEIVGGTIMSTKEVILGEPRRAADRAVAMTKSVTEIAQNTNARVAEIWADARGESIPDTVACIGTEVPLGLVNWAFEGVGYLGQGLTRAARWGIGKIGSLFGYQDKEQPA